MQLRTKTPQNTYNHKYNKEIIESKDNNIPLYVFIKDKSKNKSENLYLNGVFKFEGVEDEREKKWFKLIRNEEIIYDYLKDLINIAEINETEVVSMIKSRIGHSKFKRMLLKRKKKCEICGLDDVTFLIASHIKPWSKSSN